MRYDEVLGLLPRLHDIDKTDGLPFGLELLFWAIVVLLTLVLVRHRPAILQKAESLVRTISRHELGWLLAFVLGVIVVRVALLPWVPIPVPVLHDEFSYILASDTFAHGRLTNAPNPLWVHFESFHINMLPTYQSMYPPAQGLALAIGQWLTGNPWCGVLLSTALMCGAIYWMLLGWLPSAWAWLGGAFACVRFGIFSYWMNSYYGGSVAALGGAMVLGAFPRLRKKPGIQNGLILAAGLLIMANSRPLEGLVFSIPIVVSLMVTLFRKIWIGEITWIATAKAILPGMALLAAGIGWMAYYDWRGTGNSLVMPYQVNYQEYHFSKPYPFQKSNPIPEYRHPSMKAFYVYYELPALLQSKYELTSLMKKNVGHYYGFFVWPFALLVLPCSYAAWRSPMRAVLISLVLLSVTLFSQIWAARAHYAAPATGAVLLWLLYSLRYYRKSGSALAIWGSRAFAIVLVAIMISPVVGTLSDPFTLLGRFDGSETKGFKPEEAPLPQQYQRAWIQSALEKRNGKQLIIVHYAYRDVPWQDWIYNDADIEDAHVVWARDMGYEKNRELLDYYADRQAWYTDRSDIASLIVPYDQIIARHKLAFEGPASHADVTQPAIAAQRTPSAITKPVSVGRAEIGAPKVR